MIKFLKYDEEFLEKSWEWLNDQEIKKMTMTPNFSKEGQKIWFLNLKKKKNYFIRGIFSSETKIGVLGLKNINANSGEYWGYIGEKQYWGQGIGKIMLKYIESIAREKNLKYIYLKVSIDNKRALKLYKNEGYKLEKKEKDIYILKKKI